MPFMKIDHIISFSSEDKLHVAKNMLDTDIGRKWKCAAPGEKSAVLFLQLERIGVITGIDIGNEHSAYIEVLVSRSAEGTSEYKTLLVMSSFMSQSESKQGTNVNRVRMFKTDDLCKPECYEKWDRVKIVCTQPFNKHVKYGLSFIKFHTIESATSSNSDKKLGKFTLRPESPIDLANGMLFTKKKENVEQPKTVAQTVRAATSSLLNDLDTSVIRSPGLLPLSLKNSASKKKKIDSSSTVDVEMKPRNRPELFYTEDEEKPHPKIDRLIALKHAGQTKEMDKKEEQSPQQCTSREKNKTVEKEPKRRRQLEEDKALLDSKRKRNSVQITPKKNSPENKRATNTKSFDKLLEDAVVVISGIQNPDRANLRQKISEMGGKYKSDWDNACTHLICAFMNTPKFHQVKGKGKIVTRQWIEECYSQRKKIPWRRYALDKKEQDKDESEDEILERINELNKSPLQSIISDDETMEQASDTEERITKIKNTKTNSPKVEPKVEITNSLNTNSVNDPFSAETESEGETAQRKTQLKDKPFDFFKGKHFFLDHNFEDNIEEMLKNYIFIHEGSLCNDPSENIDYIICGKDEAQNLNALNSRAVCILPDWIVDCHKCRQFIPPDEYFIL